MAAGYIAAAWPPATSPPHGRRLHRRRMAAGYIAAGRDLRGPWIAAAPRRLWRRALCCAAISAPASPRGLFLRPVLFYSPVSPNRRPVRLVPLNLAEPDRGRTVDAAPPSPNRRPIQSVPPNRRPGRRCPTGRLGSAAGLFPISLQVVYCPSMGAFFHIIFISRVSIYVVK